MTPEDQHGCGGPETRPDWELAEREYRDQQRDCIERGG
jgi:hypothetical protein